MSTKLHLSLLLSIYLLALSCNSTKPQLLAETKQITTLMEEQEASWNNGNIEGFMKYYWKSDSLTFIGSSGINYGWKTTLDNYNKSYKTKSEMGILTFSNKSIKQLSKSYIHVIGKWHLKRLAPLDDLEGHYTLVWKKINGHWVIISDHSS